MWINVTIYYSTLYNMEKQVRFCIFCSDHTSRSTATASLTKLIVSGFNNLFLPSWMFIKICQSYSAVINWKPLRAWNWHDLMLILHWLLLSRERVLILSGRDPVCFSYSNKCQSVRLRHFCSNIQRQAAFLCSPPLWLLLSMCCLSGSNQVAIVYGFTALCTPRREIWFFFPLCTG